MKLKACLTFLFLILALGACSDSSSDNSADNGQEAVDELDY